VALSRDANLIAIKADVQRTSADAICNKTSPLATRDANLNAIKANIDASEIATDAMCNKTSLLPTSRAECHVTIPRRPAFQVDAWLGVREITYPEIYVQ
jgi:hypothetical protein